MQMTKNARNSIVAVNGAILQTSYSNVFENNRKYATVDHSLKFIVFKFASEPPKLCLYILRKLFQLEKSQNYAVTFQSCHLSFFVVIVQIL